MITIEQLERAIEIAELRDSALRNMQSYKSMAYGFWANEYSPAKKMFLHKSEISQMAAERIEKYLIKYLGGLI